MPEFIMSRNLKIAMKGCLNDLKTIVVVGCVENISKQCF
jgi:hypothetical protein